MDGDEEDEEEGGRRGSNKKTKGFPPGTGMFSRLTSAGK